MNDPVAKSIFTKFVRTLENGDGDRFLLSEAIESP